MWSPPRLARGSYLCDFLLGSHYQTVEHLGSRLKPGSPIGRSVRVKVRSTKKSRLTAKKNAGLWLLDRDHGVACIKHLFLDLCTVGG